MTDSPLTDTELAELEAAATRVAETCYPNSREDKLSRGSLRLLAELASVKLERDEAREQFQDAWRQRNEALDGIQD